MVLYQEKLMNDDGYYVCVIDGKCFKTFPALTKHVVRRLKYKTVYNYIIEHNLDSAENYIKCELCGNYVINMNKHIKIHKDTNIVEYKEKYNLKYTLSEGLRKFYSKVKSGENNTFHRNKSEYTKRAKRSMYKMEHYRTKYPELSDIEIEEIIKEKRKKCSSVLKNANGVSYWIERGYSEDEAKLFNSYKHKYNDIAKMSIVYGFDKSYKIAYKYRKRVSDKFINNYLVNPYYKGLLSILSESNIEYKLDVLDYKNEITYFKTIVVDDKLYICFSKKYSKYYIDIYRNDNNILIDRISIIDFNIISLANKIKELLYDIKNTN